MSSDYISYQEAGVNIDANDEMVEAIYSSVKSTFGPRVIAAKNGFAGLFRLDYDEKLFKKNYKNPVLVACTDGVGSKVQLAALADRYDTLGIDLVAMSVNDMLVTGAEPLFFLDYLAVNKLEPIRVAQLVKGIAAGCKMADCALIGGETAEMPDTYAKDDFDMAGFAVGVVERDRTIEGDMVREGDVILGLASSGLHSNGFSLVRQIVDTGVSAGRFTLKDAPEELKTSLAATLLAPTRIYVKPILNLMRDFTLNGIVHVTGGGFEGNVPRVLPKGVRARIDPASWPRPPIFDFLARHGEIPESEMRRVFNLGLGMIVVVPREQADEVRDRLTAMGERAYEIGTVERKEEAEPALLFEGEGTAAPR